MQIQPSDWSKVKSITNISPVTDLPGLADSPWPPDDGHCSPCSIYTGEENGFPVYHHQTSSNCCQYLAQTSCVDVATLKRFFCNVKKTATPGTDEGLFIGLVDQETLNDPNKMFDPSTWWWAGYIEDLPDADTIYYISVDINQDWPDTSQPLFGLFISNAPQGIWSVIGQLSGSPGPNSNMWVYHTDCSWAPDGWSETDHMVNLVLYTLGAGQLVEGFSTLTNPNFPGTASEGTPWDFSFTQTNQNAFPCGCPEILWNQFYDRDTGDPISDVAQFTLECGYTGADLSGSFNFSGGNSPWTFHGRIYLGHAEGSDAIVDDYYDFDVTVTPYPCSHWTSAQNCFDRGCYWWNGQCRTDPPTACSDLNNQTDCQTYGCYWWDGSCHADPEPPSCSEYYTKTTCESQGCYWWNNSCHDAAPSCSQLNNQSDCLAYGCYWWSNNTCNSTPEQSSCSDYTNMTECINNGCYWWSDNTCHSTPEGTQPPICDWIDDHGGPNGLTITDVFEIIDAYVFQTPPPGYNFIPTLTEVFGVIDYYLGFDGDSATGCDYY